MKLQCIKSRVQPLALGLAFLPAPSQAEGYRIRGRKGQVLRSRFLSTNPLCVACLARGDVTVAAEVDHIVPLSKGGPDAEHNKQGLCRECHRAKTRADSKS
jgi:5-methylcytosine-specific restriction protein A